MIIGFHKCLDHTSLKRLDVKKTIVQSSFYLCFLLLVEVILAGESALQWQRAFGGSYEDEGYSVQQTSDGGYIIAGSTISYGAGYDDVYLIKTDLSGNNQWQKAFGGMTLMSLFTGGCMIVLMTGLSDDISIIIKAELAG